MNTRPPHPDPQIMQHIHTVTLLLFCPTCQSVGNLGSNDLIHWESDKAFSNFLTIIPPIFFVMKMSVFTSAVYIQIHSRILLLWKQTLWTLIRRESDLGPYCLEYRLRKYISRWESRRQLLWMVGKGFTREFLVGLMCQSCFWQTHQLIFYGN